MRERDQALTLPQREREPPYFQLVEGGTFVISLTYNTKAMEICESASQDARPHYPHGEDEGLDATNNADYPHSRQYSTMENPVSTARAASPPTKKSAIMTRNKKGRSPTVGDVVGRGTPHSSSQFATALCICPFCDKVLGSMKSLYGHVGRSHRVAISQDKIKYACPFCNDDPLAQMIFDTTEELASHIDASHPDCMLLPSRTETSSTASAAAAAATTTNKAREAHREQRSPAPPSAASKQRKSARRNFSPDLPSSSDSIADRKPPEQLFEHPLCKCPVCPRILPPQGIFGHFGRVHSGQLAGRNKFEWENVAYACPYCLEDGDSMNDGSSPGPTIYRTFELIETHVRRNHPNCHLTNALIGGSNRSNRAFLLPKPDDVCSSVSVPTRKSRRCQRPAGDEGDGDIEADSANSSTVTTRKSQRIRRGRGVISPGEGNCEHQVVAKQQDIVVDSDIVELYNCPDCNKKNLTKHGLQVHYGMEHGGKVDMDRAMVATKRKTKVDVARLGPWTQEEHEAFLEGHRRIGNRWKQISVEYVPSRDAKQVGSHALNYFTSRGEWQHVASFRPELINTENDQGPRSDASGVSSPHQRRSGRVTRNKHSWIGNTISTGPMQTNTSKEQEVSANEEKKKQEPAKAAVLDIDDGNSSHCIICFQGGNIVCCSKCPRAYHPRCLNINVDLLPDDWQCNRCKRDLQIVTGLGEEISQKYAFGSKKIRVAYVEFKDCPDYNKCCSLLSNILDIVNKLLVYDYGYVFSEPGKLLCFMLFLFVEFSYVHVYNSFYLSG